MLRFMLFVSTFFLFSCASYVKDGLAEDNNLLEGFISPQVYQFWYEEPWDNWNYYISGLEAPKQGTRGVRFIDLVVGSRAKIDSVFIRKEVGMVFSRLRCGNDNFNIIDQLPVNALTFQVYKEEYYFSGLVRYLIRVRAKNLEELLEDTQCL